jgi:extracellular elastinolytic metalloproteinase
MTLLTGSLRRPLAACAVGVLVAGLGLPATPANASPDEPAATDGAGTASGDPVEIALAHLRADPAGVGVTADDVAELVVASSYRSEHNGVTHVNLNQRFRGLEVFGAYATVNVATDGRVVFVGDSLVAGLPAGVSGTPGAPGLDAVAAVEAAATGLELDRPVGLRPLARRAGPAQETVLSDGGISDAPIPARLGWQPTDEGLRLAWQLVIDDTSGSHLWNVTVDAQSGDVLQVDDWTSHDSLDVLAATLARPASRSAPALPARVSSARDPVDDGSAYRVVAHPAESPNDADRTLVTSPADRAGSPFGWHDTDGTPGAEFTVTRGNNVHAYLDQDANNVPDPGFDVDGGPELVFDFDAALDGHAQNYRDAATTSLFYWNNLVHDVTYRYGFTEAAGNFQANNYGRGGAAGDYVRAEAADGAGTNNANFSTPAVDGTGVPRMQMFLWPGDQFGPQNQVVVDGVGSFGAGWARFAQAPDAAGVSGEVVDAGNGCTPEAYPDPLPDGDWIALVTTGSCTDPTKGQVAQAQGAGALIVAGGSGGVLGGAITAPRVTIPVVSLSAADGDTIRGALPATGTVRQHPDHPGIRDGDLEAGIIIHEFGHGVSNRLTGGPTVNCLTGQEQAGEGWSDFLAIAILLDPARDDPDGPRGMGPYALFQDDRRHPGIRPAPYSRNMAIQPFTYDSIKSGGWLDGSTLSLPHGLGHGWAAVLWDMTWDLIDKHGFNPDVYAPWYTGGNNRAIQYVIDGLKFQGCAPGLLDARDAIIAAADLLSGGEDTCTIWASFARRGLGFSAVQGTSASRNDNTEAFDTHPDCREGFLDGIADPPALNVVNRGSAVTLEFSVGGYQGLDILAENSPYSRQVDCTTLRTEDPGAETITPRPLPVPAETPGNARLSYDPATDRYMFPWKTERDWGGTCREFVLTRHDGVQHRAFFYFKAAPAASVTGRVLDSEGQPVADATVVLRGTISQRTTTDRDGRYSFPEVPRGTYLATAAGPGCHDPQTQEVAVSRSVTLDFTLPPCTLWRASVSSDGVEGDGASQRSSVSGDGRYVAFESRSSNLVPGDTNGASDIFVHDRVTGVTERVSVASDGTQANANSFVASISADGRYVAFYSIATNLVPGDTNGASDIFVHDRVTGVTERVSVASDGTQANANSLVPSLSADGRFVAFQSVATNLVPGDTNGNNDIFVHDRVTGVTERVSVASDGTQGNGISTTADISGDGRFVAFQSAASNLVPGDTNGATDVFVHDRLTGVTERVSVASDGTQGNANTSEASLSADGRYVAFQSAASNLVPGDTNGATDVFVHDRLTGVTERVSVASDGAPGDANSFSASVSADGRYVAFDSGATNLVADDTNGFRDVFVHDRETGVTQRVSVTSDGTQGNGTTSEPAISADGRYVAFESAASNLVPGDTNEVQDVFARDRTVT